MVSSNNEQQTYNFKVEVEKDITNVFLDPAFFGEIHEVEGHQITCVLAQNQGLVDSKGLDDGLTQVDVQLFANQADLPKRFPSGSIISVNGREMIVEYHNIDMGMASIGLIQNRST